MKKTFVKKLASLALTAVMLTGGLPVSALTTQRRAAAEPVFSYGSPAFVYRVTSAPASSRKTVKLVQMEAMLPGGSYAGYTGGYVLPETVISGDGVFGTSYTVTEIAGDNPVGESGAFRGLPVSRIEIPKTVETIGAAAFYDCANLQAVTIPTSVLSIDPSAFGGSTAEVLNSLKLTLKVMGATTLVNPVSYSSTSGRLVTLPKPVDALQAGAALTVGGQITQPVDISLSNSGSVLVNGGALLTVGSVSGNSRLIRLRVGAKLVNETGADLIVTGADNTAKTVAPGETLTGTAASTGDDPVNPPSVNNRPKITVNYGGTVAVQQSGKVVVITPFDGYHIQNVSINGASVGTLSRYTFETASRENTVDVTFAEGKTLPPDEPDNPDDPIARFTDLKPNGWYLESVGFMVKNKIFLGVSETEFAPNNPVTRAMFVTLLSRLKNYEKKYEVPCTSPKQFPDVKPNSWYSQASAWAGGLKLTAGVTDDGNFRPSSVLTREQFAMILFRFTQAMGYDTVADESKLNDFKDADKISPEAREAMAWAVTNGYLDGKNNNMMDPLGETSRAETAAILMRFLQSNSSIL